MCTGLEGCRFQDALGYASTRVSELRVQLSLCINDLGTRMAAVSGMPVAACVCALLQPGFITVWASTISDTSSRFVSTSFKLAEAVWCFLQGTRLQNDVFDRSKVGISGTPREFSDLFSFCAAYPQYFTCGLDARMS